MVSGLAFVAAILFLIGGALYLMNKNVASALISFGLTVLALSFGL